MRRQYFAVWQLKHARNTLRQRFDICPQQHETGVHGTQRGSIRRHARQHNRQPDGTGEEQRESTTRRRAFRS